MPVNVIGTPRHMNYDYSLWLHDHILFFTAPLSHSVTKYLSRVAHSFLLLPVPCFIHRIPFNLCNKWSRGPATSSLIYYTTPILLQNQGLQSDWPALLNQSGFPYVLSSGAKVTSAWVTRSLLPDTVTHSGCYPSMWACHKKVTWPVLIPITSWLQRRVETLFQVWEWTLVIDNLYLSNSTPGLPSPILLLSIPCSSPSLCIQVRWTVSSLRCKQVRS